MRERRAAEVARRAGGAAVEAACDDALRSASRGCHWLREECSYGRFWEDLRIEVEDSWVSSSSIRVAAQGQQKAGVGDKRCGAAAKERSGSAEVAGLRWCAWPQEPRI